MEEASSNPNPKTVSEALRQAEQRLAAQIQFQIELDRRISSLTGIMTAGMTAFAVLAATLANRTNPSDTLIFASLGVAVSFFLAAFCFARTLRVIDFFALGNKPEDLKYFLALSEDELKLWTLEGIQERLNFNEKQSAGMHRWISAGFVFLATAPLVGAAAGAIKHYGLIGRLYSHLVS